MEKLNLDSKVFEVKGVGPKMYAKMNNLGIFSIRDLLLYFPRRYEDFTEITLIDEIPEIKRLQNNASDVFTIKGEIVAIANKKTRRRGFAVTEATVIDATGSIKVVWFNQAFLARMLRPGSTVILSGKVNFDYFSKSYAMESPVRSNRPKIIPVYSETEGISSWYINKLVNILKGHINEVEEYLPLPLIQKSKFKNQNQEMDRSSTTLLNKEGKTMVMPIREAISQLHFPASSERLEEARRRMAFDELFFISLKANLAKAEIERSKAPVIATDLDNLKTFIASLPFKLTNDQKRAIWQIVQDMEKSVPMNRLLNGDVGSGKTVVAAAAAFAAMKAAHRTLLMAPTEILANQHFLSFQKLLGADKIGIATSSTKKNLDAEILIGTHALLNLKENFNHLGLVIVDEQHRFGVKQRQALHDLCSGELRPHFLSMTATPIPRTLHLALFGDLDISVIREKPANRKEIKTRFVEAANRAKAYEFIRRQLESERQAFVICPLIEDKAESEKKVILSEAKNPAERFNSNAAFGLDPSAVPQDDNMSTQIDLFEIERKTVLGEAEKLKGIFPEFRIEILHGRIKSKEKDEIMHRFSMHEIDLLVSTSVVEVGVDVPNASIMLIEDAERFGLAQLHQFRGRVGRGEHQSFCFLFSSTMSEKAKTRLRGLENINDGFRLAELDLEMRGSGSIFGTEQSGLLDLKFANLSDQELIQQASEAAKELIGADSKLLNYPLLKNKIAQYLEHKHLE